MKETENPSWAERLSALADGEAEGADAMQLTARWRDDAELRERWHGWHLIGDVMRSEELVGRRGDARFLASLREKLAAEPVVLAPAPVLEQPSAARRRAGLRWRAPAAVAAGFVMVAGALVVMQPTAPEAPALLARETPAAVPPATVAAASAQQPTQVVATAAPPAPRPAAEPLRGVLIRDARMQQYFDAHQQFGGSTALGLPSSFLRNATYDAPAEPGSR
ncbi:MAG TPA: sigma-E factor negative regulatory protein [Methylibium sp.]|uniref:sigma-E factor negative regulatory protein n=1 Tax=Methylibium sp. TaxID=2067992 RepID=UPI002DB81AE4|nr:sigma-E factor negative regulatory protein [Methylibium sp.]HEU4458662.1 sigma-E factor negative regulatory protein [Methylibium sp.]